MRLYLRTFVLVLVLSTCKSPPIDEKNHSYPQYFKTPVAVLIQERNGEPFYFASAFLRDKELGIFVTAKHFVEDIGGKDFKIFFNGRAYNGLVTATSIISDLALVGIKDPNFNSVDFPEALVLSADQLKVGDSVKVLGIHPHPPELQINKAQAEIFRGYYTMFWKENEFVFDELKAMVMNLTMEVKNKDIVGAPDGFDFISNTYVEINMEEDHQFSFGGLSGGPVVNQKNEVIGIVANGQEGGHILFGQIVLYIPWHRLRLVSVEELYKLTTTADR